MVAGKTMPEDEFGWRQTLRLVPGDAQAPMQLKQWRTRGTIPMQLEIGRRSSSHREYERADD